MMKNSFLFAIIAAFILLSCTRKERMISEVEMLSNQKISFVDGYIELPCKSDVKIDSLLNKEIKIVSYITDMSCTPCGVNTLNIFQSEISKIDDRIAYIIVIHSEDPLFLDMTDSLALDLPLMYYDSTIFGELNHLEDVLARNRTFLLNKDNEIVLVGEPLGKEKLTRLYKKCIDSLYVAYNI